MKLRLLILFSSAFLCSSFNYQNQTARLCKSNEEVIFSFLLPRNHKIVSFCKDKKDKYIVYRFGTLDKIEFEYPKQLDSNSWTNFKYYSIHRGGGNKYDGMGDISMTFTNDNVKYKIFHQWQDENKTNEIGINVTFNGKITKLKGNLNTQMGALQDLDFESDKIKNTYEDE